MPAQNSITTKTHHAGLAYQDAGREITQNFSTMASNMSLATGMLAAILTVIGAGELFGVAKGDQSTINAIPPLSTISLLILSMALPLLVRFFMRSLLAYQNLLRYRAIHDAAWKFINQNASWSYFRDAYRLYIEEWRSPKPLINLIASNLRYGFLWLFVVMIGAIAWGFISNWFTTGCIVAATILVVGVGWEIFSLFKGMRKYFTFAALPGNPYDSIRVCLANRDRCMLKPLNRKLNR
ncbi:hypothetical protein [Nonomuraea sp. NPDC050691]|uniref:hypothetical protein n=1 Tax=Nonomuraea sp. NPDC050691 TaxID=3155661 RepID=UPI0033DF2949